MVSVGSVSVDVVPSAKGWVAKLRSQLLPEADALGLEIGRAISARINEALGNAHLTVDVDTAVADVQLAATEAIVDRLDGRKAHITADADTGAAEAQLAGLTAQGAKSRGLFSGIASSISASVTGMSPLIALVGVLGLALIPVVATAAGLTAALVLPLAAAGGGLGLGAILAGKAVANLEKTNKQIEALKKSAATLQDPKARAAALAQAAALEKSLTGPQKAFLAAQDKLGDAFSKLQTGKVGAALFAPLVSGMNLLSKILPAMAPVIESVSKALVGLLDSLAKSASGKGFTTFVDGFAKLAGSTITTAGRSLALFGQGLFNILRDFLPLSASFGSGLTGLGQQFLDFSKKTSTKEGIAKFVEYVKTEGPKVVKAIGDIIVAAVRIGVALAPVGAKILGLIDAIAEGINRIPTGLATAFLSPILGLSKAVGDFMIITGKAFSLLGNVPKFGWAKDLGAALQSAGHGAKDFGDTLKTNNKVKIDFSDLTKLARVAHTTDASLRILLGLPKLKPKVDTKPLMDATTGTQTLIDRAKAFGRLKTKDMPFTHLKADEANLSLLQTLNTARKVAGLKNIDVKVAAAGAKVARDLIQGLIDTIARLHGKTVTITTVHQGGKTLTGGGNTAHVATGGHISGPGTGTSDSIPAMLSNGEYVINAAATKRHLALLHRINSQGYANGGVAGSPSSGSDSGDSSDAVLRSVLREFRKGFQIASDGRGGQRLILNGA